MNATQKIHYLKKSQAASRKTGAGPEATLSAADAELSARTEGSMAKKANRSRNKKSGVFLVDDHPIVREGLSQLISQQPDLAVCGESEGDGDLLSQLGAARPDIVILDISLKDISGIELLKDIRARHPKLPVLVLSMYDEALYAERALRAGAMGYIMKQEATEKVIHAIRKILAGEVYLEEKATARLLQKISKTSAEVRGSMLDLLSDREMQVFQLLGDGHSTRDIAERLNRSIKTVETYRANIKEKLNLKNATELTYLAIQWSQGRKSG